MAGVSEEGYFKEYTNSLAVIGALSFSYIAFKALCTLWGGFKTYVLSSVFGLGADVASLGKWAVVTGATDGIGKAYAVELARRGMNIVLISRSVEKLQAVAQEIESASSVETKCIQIDFSGGMEIYETISAEISGLEIGVLVNNVGTSYAYPTLFHELEDNKEIHKIININCCSVTFMTRIVLPQMLERKKGAIISLSSVSGALPTPLLAVYSGTKAFVDYFSRCLQREYQGSGVIIQCVMPSFVATKMSKIRHSSWIIPNPETYVRSALATLGVESRTYGYMAHGLQGFISRAIPESLYLWVTMKTLGGQTKKAREKRRKAQ